MHDTRPRVCRAAQATATKLPAKRKLMTAHSDDPSAQCRHSVSLASSCQRDVPRSLSEAAGNSEINRRRFLRRCGYTSIAAQLVSMTPDVQSALQTVLHRGILLTMEVGFGSNCDIAASRRHVGFAPVSGLARGLVQCRRRANCGNRSGLRNQPMAAIVHSVPGMIWEM